jgi:hypothetical protein
MTTWQFFIFEVVEFFYSVSLSSKFPAIMPRAQGNDEQKVAVMRFATPKIAPNRPQKIF